jgi:hypothetical protein
MNISRVVLSVILFCSHAVVIADSQSDPATQSMLSRRMSGSYSPYPVSSGRNFDLVNVGIRPNIDIGCGGLDLKNSLTKYFKADYKNILDYIKANAVGAAVNYIIYENPTLYSLMQDIKHGVEWNIGQNMLGCQNVRALADMKRQNGDYYAAAKSKCLADDNTEIQCLDDGKLEKYINRTVSDRQNKIGNQNGRKYASVNDAIVHDMNLNDADKKLLGQHTPDQQLVDGNVQQIPPKSSITADQQKFYEDNKKRLMVIFNEAARKQNWLDHSANNAARTDYFNFNKQDGVAPLTAEAISKINLYPLAERNEAIDRIARLAALGQTKALLRREIMINLNGLQSAAAKNDVYPSEVIERRQAITDLRLQMDLIGSEYDSVSKQAEFEAQMIDNAPTAARPIIR